MYKWFFFFLFCSSALFAQKSSKLSFFKKDTISKSEGVFVLPLLYYTPDTRFAAGLAGVYYFNTAKSDSLKDKTRLSYTKALADYTQNNQLDVWASWNIFTSEEKFLFKGEFRYRNFPDRFYGVGNNTKEDQKEFYSYDYFQFKIMGMRQVFKKLFIGIDYHFSTEYNFELSETGKLNNGNITGYDGGINSGLGGIITYDTRDNVVNAYSGMIFEVSSYTFLRAIGGSFNYTNINVLFNKYWEIKANHVIAINTVLNSNFGNVPFLDMAKVGGDGILRGYANNRFRDLHFIGTQIEYRFPVWWRFGGVIFTGVGDVFQNPKDLSLNRTKYSFGAGIRFAINRKERLNVRLDYGVGRNSSAYYLMVTEAF